MRSMTAPNPNLRVGICVGLGERFSKENAAFFAEKELREGRRINLEGETKARYLSRADFHLKAEEEDSE